VVAGAAAELQRIQRPIELASAGGSRVRVGPSCSCGLPTENLEFNNNPIRRFVVFCNLCVPSETQVVQNCMHQQSDIFHSKLQSLRTPFLASHFFLIPSQSLTGDRPPHSFPRRDTCACQSTGPSPAPSVLELVPNATSSRGTTAPAEGRVWGLGMQRKGAQATIRPLWPSSDRTSIGRLCASGPRDEVALGPGIHRQIDGIEQRPVPCFKNGIVSVCGSRT
jgi:hypothetical protein